MVKEEYEKPTVTLDSKRESVFPAAVVAAFPALAGGVMLGTQIKKTLNDGRSLHTCKALQRVKTGEVVS